MLTQSEDLFRKYCSDSGIPCRPIEVTGVRTPDFEVELAGVKVICELKQLDPNEDDLRERAKIIAGVSEGRLIPNRLRRLLKGISGQLKSASTAGHPTLMIVYDNTPFCAYLDDDNVRESMFGRWSITEFFDKRQSHVTALWRALSNPCRMPRARVLSMRLWDCIPMSGTAPRCVSWFPVCA